MKMIFRCRAAGPHSSPIGPATADQPALSWNLRSCDQDVGEETRVWFRSFECHGWMTDFCWIWKVFSGLLWIQSGQQHVHHRSARRRFGDFGQGKTFNNWKYDRHVKTVPDGQTYFGGPLYSVWKNAMYQGTHLVLFDCDQIDLPDTKM